jgi:predicted metalloprotease with PDZ domain
MRLLTRGSVLLAVGLLVTISFQAAAPVRYLLTFPEPQHRWMQVEATFPDLPDTTLELRMSRSSPGRYSLHDFAKNVFDVHAFDRDGREIMPARPDPYGWNVAGHGGAVTVRYRVFGDVVDGTYLGIDSTHAHINMPAAIMWGRGLDDRPAALTFVPPAGSNWEVATQLHRADGPFDFTAPNLQYLMDSPAEFGPIAFRQFVVGSRAFRVALHHTGSAAEFEGYVKDVEKVVRQEGAVFGEYPSYEPGFYTFIADYLPYAAGDAMEHRNSAILTERNSIRTASRSLLETMAHEFFHSWNVERIRPRSLEPFDFERVNMSGELWLAEGFTQYYGPLMLHRAGLVDLATTADTLSAIVDTVASGPGRAARSAEEMSQMAGFIDGGTPADRTNWSNTVISYYPFGAAIALALDLTMREHSEGRIGLDDFMREMWRVHGKPGGMREGYVDRPYTMADVESRLAEVSGDRSFAHDFFARYIQGREVADYARLLARAGFVVRKQSPGRAWWGDLRVDAEGGRIFIAALVPAGSPAYVAGLEQDDELRQIDGTRIRTIEDVSGALQRHKPGDSVRVLYADRSGKEKNTSVTLAADPHLQVVPVEAAGEALTPGMRAFRDGWLASRQLN